MQVTIQIENIPLNHRPYIVARLIYGRHLYYGSYLTEQDAQAVVDKLENAMIVKKG